MSEFKFESWPTEYRTITQHFGVNPQHYSQFGLPGHEGVDMRAPKGSRVYAVAAGKVKLVHSSPNGHNYGVHLRITHLDGYETIYAHLQEVLLKEGDLVLAGETIALADSTGNSSGDHLHLVLKKEGAELNGWPYNIIDPTPYVLPLINWTKPAGPYIEGWVCTVAVTYSGGLAQANVGGIHLRTGPTLESEAIDLIPAGTLMILTGRQDGECSQVKVPVRALDDAQAPLYPENPSEEDMTPPVGVVLGWAWSAFIDFTGRLGTVGRNGANLRSKSQKDSTQLGQMQWGTLCTLVGEIKNGYAPVFVYAADLVNLRKRIPELEYPEPLPGEETEEETNKLDTLSGWVLTAQISQHRSEITTGRYGVNLRISPTHSATILGYLPAGILVLANGQATGEFTPVRVETHLVRRPGDDEPTDIEIDPDREPLPLGQARIGLHASADPDISAAELSEFVQLRPGIIKVLSFHNPEALRKLATAHPNANWIVRAFLDFGSRSLSPQQFLDFTISDMKRTMTILEGRNVVIELHNEPNLAAEGWGFAWSDGVSFATWWLRLLRLYRYVLPDAKFIYPGLSPGNQVVGVKEDHIRFIEASRAAVEAADGIGVHAYWSTIYPMSKALDVLDDYAARFPQKPIWLTEASNNRGGLQPADKAMEYLHFWGELQKRALVQGVTYFVASASNPDFADEVFLGKGMSRIIGAR